MADFDEYWHKQDLMNMIVQNFQEHTFPQRNFAKKLGISLSRARKLLHGRADLFVVNELEIFAEKMNLKITRSFN